VNAATAAKDIAWLTALAAKEFPGVRITPRVDLAIVAVQGPNARAKAWRALPGTETATAALKPFQAASIATQFGDLFIARTGYTGEEASRSCCPDRRPRRCGARSLRRASRRAGSPLATRCGSKPE
jgi:aminomethyltransferase